ncbi:MAG: uracil-DNA glycosylase family protein [Lentimicrobiaceae bacterium]|nr:uracil-DNA glycosylase family protein [Lentimicrobiaceae bacterium]
MNLDLSKLEGKSFEKKLEVWAEEVATKCHDYALKNDVDFYVFQSSLPEKPNPDLLIVGINPGGHVSYKEKMKEKGKEKRTWQDLAQGFNTYSRKPYWETSNANNYVMRRALVGTHDYDNVPSNGNCIFFNEKLFNILDNAVIMNMYYFNTKKESDIEKMCQEDELKYCKEKTLELIEMLNPKNILFFTTSGKNLFLMEVKKIKNIGSFVKSGELEGRTVYAIPHPSGWRWKEGNRVKTGEMLDKVL